MIPVVSSVRQRDTATDTRPADEPNQAKVVPMPTTRRAAPPVAKDFADALLAAVAQMAALSPRRQADVSVAMRRAGLTAPPETVGTTLDQLLRDGCVELPLRLSDGGILVSLTMRGIEHLATTSYRHAVAGLMAGGL